MEIAERDAASTAHAPRPQRKRASSWPYLSLPPRLKHAGNADALTRLHLSSGLATDGDATDCEPCARSASANTRGRGTNAIRSRRQNDAVTIGRWHESRLSVTIVQVSQAVRVVENSVWNSWLSTISMDAGVASVALLIATGQACTYGLECTAIRQDIVCCVTTAMAHWDTMAIAPMNVNVLRREYERA